MDVKRMHEMIEKLSECAKAQFDKGIDKVDTCEMGKVIDMIKDLSEAMYYRELTKAMQEFDAEIQFAVHADASSVFNVLGINHTFIVFIIIMLLRCFP